MGADCIAHRSRPRTAGRYSQVSLARPPGDHLPKEGRQGAHITVVHGAVDDPNSTLRGRRQRVAINAQTDPLEYEYSRGRMSEAAYRAGRIYQRILERSGQMPTGSQWRQGDRVDAATAHELAIIRAIETATAAVRMLDDLRPIIGMMGERILYMALIERKPLSDISQRMTQSNDRHATRWAGWMFRQALEAIADHWAKTLAPS